MRQWLGPTSAALCALFLAASPVRAAFHLWGIKEIFSSADGSVQFIEFFTTSGGQEFLGSHTLTATSDGALATFTFPGAIPVTFPNSTANHHFLVATPGFAALPGGVTPDYGTLPANFFNPNAASIAFNFASGFDTLTVAGSAIPKDGVTSLTDSNTAPGGPDNLAAGINSPTNFAGVSGSINVAPPAFLAGDFDENGTVAGADLNVNWRTGFGLQGPTVDHADGDADDDHNVDGDDLLIWQRQLGGGTLGPVAEQAPEPASGALLLAALLAGMATRRQRAAR